MLHRIRPLIAAALFLPACGGDQGLDGDPGEPGEGGASSLVTTTELGLGDADCPFGGTRIDIGLDNGDGDETAGDGVLGAGEIDSTSFLCNGEDEDPDRPLDGPAGPAGQFVIDLSGGDGSTNAGGSGGSFETYMSSGSGGGHLKIFATGLVDASFTVPSVTPDLGENPETVTADATVFERAVADNSGLVAGSLVRRTTDDTLYRFNGATDDVVTGLSVAAGVTLTFEQATTDVSISLPAGLINAGTLTTDFAGDGVTRNPLTLSCSTFVGAEGSSIDLSGGTASAGNDGGGGGDLSLTADDPLPAGPGTGGVIVNQGTINTAGGQGDNGGSGGNVYLQGNQNTYNTGTIDTNGGTGTAGAGGGGGGSYFFAISGVWNSGDISASGGVGSVNGGSGSSINLDCTGGDVGNTGNLSARGGASDPSCASSCSAGNGGNITAQSFGGTVRTSGNLDASGGDSVTGVAGGGGFVGVYTYDSGSPIGSLPAGDIWVSGNLLASGGDGNEGASGGNVAVQSFVGSFPLKQEIIFYGYTDIEMSGGNGETGGGSTSALVGFVGPSPLPPPTSSGSVVIEPNIRIVGGSANTGPGGAGGYLNLLTDLSLGFGSDQQQVILRGDVDLSGGSGVDGGSVAGALIEGLNGITIGGSFICNGGSGADSGAASTELRFRSPDGDVAVSGALVSAAGGACTADGCTAGSGGNLLFTGVGAQNSADLSAAGGDASATGGTGGSAASIVVQGFGSGATSSAMNVDILGGTGATPGANGEYFVGGVNQSGPFLP